MQHDKAWGAELIWFSGEYATRSAPVYRPRLRQTGAQAARNRLILNNFALGSNHIWRGNCIFSVGCRRPPEGIRQGYIMSFPVRIRRPLLLLTLLEVAFLGLPVVTVTGWGVHQQRPVLRQLRLTWDRLVGGNQRAYRIFRK